MRVIHYSAEEGRFEAVVFTEEEDAPLDFVDRDVASKPGFKVDFDENVVFESGFLPAEGDLYVKVGIIS